MRKSVCSLHRTMELIGGKWKPLLLFHLLKGPQRSGVLQRTVPDISNKMFTQAVRELERDGLLTRTVHAVVPPQVDYTLTPLGLSLAPILQELDQWGKQFLP
jgi:DNA-binding HxlR family transcriptional regulator